MDPLGFISMDLQHFGPGRTRDPKEFTSVIKPLLSG